MKKLRKKLMLWLMVVAFVFSTFATFLPMTVHAANDYESTLADRDLGTAVVGYNYLDFHGYMVMTKTGTAVMWGDLIKVELTAGDVDAFFVGNLGGGKISGTGALNVANLYPKAGLTSGTYTATATLSHDTDEDGNWETLDTATVTFRVVNSSTTQHKVTFELNGGTMIGTNPIKVYDGDKVTRPSIPTKTGWKFEDWYKNSAFTTKFDFANTKITSDTTIYARYTKNIAVEVYPTTGGKIAATNTSSEAPTYRSKGISHGVVIGTEGKTIYLHAKADENYEFVKWTKNGAQVSTDAKYALALTESNNKDVYIAEFKKVTQQHPVTFVLNGGTMAGTNPVMVNDGGKVTKPSDPLPPTNYRFVGWYKDSTMNTPFDFDKEIIENPTNIYAKYIEQFNITIDYNGGTSILIPTPLDKGTKLIRSDTENAFKNTSIVQPPSVDKEFDYIEIDGVKWVDSTYILNSNITMKIIWKDKASTQHKVTFKDGSTELTSLGTTVNSGETISKPASPSKTDYRFIGWYKEATFNNLFDFTKPITTDTIIYAKYAKEYNIIITNGGPDKTVAIYGELVSITADPAPSGKEFDKWEVEEGTISLANANNSTTTFTMPESNVKVTATYKSASTQHKVTFKDGSTELTSLEKTVNNGETISEPAGPAKANHRFVGWYDDGSFSKAFDFTAPITADVTIYAKYIEVFNVEYNVNGGSKLNLPDETVDKGRVINRSDVETRYRNTANVIPPAHSELDYLEINGSKWTANTYEVNGNTTIKAIWKPVTLRQHTVNFVLAGGKILGSSTYSVKVTDGGNVIQPSDPEKSGYRFNGWYTTIEYSTLFDFANTKINELTLIYAKFVEQVNITVNYNGGTNNGFTPMPLDKGTVLNRSDIESSLNSSLVTPPTDKEFDYLEIDGVKWTESTYKLNSNITIKIVWKDKAVTPTYTIESGANQTYTIDSNVDVVIKASGDLVKLGKIKVDGIDIDALNYDVVNGSTILTLKASYLNTLSEGDHSVEFVYNDGSVSTGLKVVKAGGGNSGGNANTGGNNTGVNNKTKIPNTGVKAPSTGDSSEIALWEIMFITSLVCFGLTMLKRKKYSN